MMKCCFLFVLVKVDVFKIILLQIWLILSSRNKDARKSVLPRQPLHCQVHYTIKNEISQWKLSQWFLLSNFRRRSWLGNGHSWWYVSDLFDIIDALTISFIHIRANNRYDEMLFLVCAGESGCFKKILLQIWLILSSRNEDVRKSVLPRQPLHCQIHYTIKNEISQLLPK